MGYTGSAMTLGGAFVGQNSDRARGVAQRWPRAGNGGLIIVMDIGAFAPPDAFRAGVDNLVRGRPRDHGTCARLRRGDPAGHHGAPQERGIRPRRGADGLGRVGKASGVRGASWGLRRSGIKCALSDARDEMRTDISAYIDDLKKILTDLRDTGDDGFEGLIGTVLSEIAGVPFRLAGSGSQFGVDGKSTYADDGICFECKRYKNIECLGRKSCQRSVNSRLEAAIPTFGYSVLLRRLKVNLQAT